MGEKKKVLGLWPAFPSPDDWEFDGMSYRHWLAGTILASMAGARNDSRSMVDTVELAVAYADKMISKLADCAPEED